MIKDIKQLPKEIDKIIDFYIPYKKLLSLPKKTYLFHLLNIAGVYILSSKKEIIYIGCSSNIGVRLKTHISSSPFKKKIKDIKIIRFHNWDESAGVEARLIDKFKPIHNKVNHQLYYYDLPENFDLQESIKELQQCLDYEDCE